METKCFIKTTAKLPVIAFVCLNRKKIKFRRNLLDISLSNKTITEEIYFDISLSTKTYPLLFRPLN